MIHRIVIETSPDGVSKGWGSTYRADVVEGPEWAKPRGAVSGHATARSAYLSSRLYVETARGRLLGDTFEFMHVEVG